MLLQLKPHQHNNIYPFRSLNQLLTLVMYIAMSELALLLLDNNENSDLNSVIFRPLS